MENPFFESVNDFPAFHIDDEIIGVNTETNIKKEEKEKVMVDVEYG